MDSTGGLDPLPRPSVGSGRGFTLAALGVPVCSLRPSFWGPVWVLNIESEDVFGMWGQFGQSITWRFEGSGFVCLSYKECRLVGVSGSLPEYLLAWLKVAIIPIFVLIMDPKTVCMWKVRLSPAELHSIFQLIVFTLKPRTSLFWSVLTVLIRVISRSLFSAKELFKPTVPYLPSIKSRTEEVSDQLVTKVEHETAEEPHISLRSKWRPKAELKE